MLVLSRKVGEQVRIGPQGQVVVTIVGVQGGRIQVGIEADSSIPISRVVSQTASSFQEGRLPRES